MALGPHGMPVPLGEPDITIECGPRSLLAAGQL